MNYEAAVYYSGLNSPMQISCAIYNYADLTKSDTLIDGDKPYILTLEQVATQITDLVLLEQYFSVDLGTIDFSAFYHLDSNVPNVQTKINDAYSGKPAITRLCPVGMI